MKRSLLLIIVLFFTQIGVSQELQATVSINYQQVNNGNPQLFKNLEKQVKEFLNTTKWTDREIKDEEKIEISFRTSLIPGAYGESIVMRILNPESHIILEDDDILWIAGDRKKIAAFLNA